MANKNRRCCGCKNYFLAEKMIKTPIGFFCSAEHAIEYANDRGKKKQKQAMAERKKEFYSNDRSRQLRDAQAAVNAFVRLRDKENPCISCNRHHSGQYHAGHFRSVGSASHLRFNTRQIFKQCQPCNLHLSGNILEYRKNLVEKFGAEYVESIESDNNSRKFSIEDIKAIKTYYRGMVRRMRSENPC